MKRTPLVLVLTALLLAGLALWKDAAAGPDVAPIQGRWLAVSGRHEGLLFEVTCDRVLLFQQGEAYASYRLTDIEVEREPAETVYYVEYRLPDGGHDMLRLVDGGKAPRAIYLNRSSTPWVLAPEAETPWDELDVGRCPEAAGAGTPTP